MTGLYGASVLLIALPLAGAIVLLVGGRVLDRIGHLIGCATVIAAFVLGFAVFLNVLGEPSTDRVHQVTIFTWIQSGSLNIDLGLFIDPLSLTFVLLITGVGSLIHIYSIGYMAHDPERRKFFAYLNLFVAAMLLLVLGNSFVTLYAGWEGVGLASYLLIGFWSHKPSAAAAAKKAFIVAAAITAALVAGVAFAAWTAGGTGHGSAQAKTAVSLTTVAEESLPTPLKTSEYWVLPSVANIRKMPIARPASPTRFIRNAFLPAVAADGRVYQKEISR